MNRLSNQARVKNVVNSLEFKRHAINYVRGIITITINDGIVEELGISHHTFKSYVSKYKYLMIEKYQIYLYQTWLDIEEVLKYNVVL